MACDAGTQEWTFDLALDSNPTVPDSRLIFCIGFPTTEPGAISGKVLDTNGVPLSVLGGHIQPFVHAGPGLGASLMSFDFILDNVNVTMSGLRLGPRFEGRFRAFATAQLAAAAPSGGVKTVQPPAPADGDTGTGTGTQT